MRLVTEFIHLPMDPSARIYWPFLLLSLLVMVIWSGKKSLRDFLSPSSKLDFKIMLINLPLKALIFPMLLMTSYQVSLPTLKLLRSFFPGFSGVEIEGMAASILVTLIAFIVDDFFRFTHHLLMHKLPVLKKAHRTHHSALVLTPFTLYRSHPLESLIAGFRNVLSVGLSLGIYSFLIQRSVTGLEILGVNLFGFIFNAFMANLRHSSVPLGFGPFEYFFVSPRMHQIHHSNDPKHFGKNYGVALALWDQLFGTFYRPTKREMTTLIFGVHKNLDEKSLEEATTLKGALVDAFNSNSLLSKTSSLKPIVQQSSR